MNNDQTQYSVCVFCGAKPGLSGTRHVQDATTVGQLIAQQGWRLVYGGGHLGLMGAVADGALAAGGQVLGIIPDFLVKAEVAHPRLTELRIVPDMSTRKDRLIGLSDSFLILPGGMGTLDELFEVITLAQLGNHNKPIVMYNPDGFYDGLRDFCASLVKQGFVSDLVWSKVLFVPELRAAVMAAGVPQPASVVPLKAILAPRLINDNSH